MDELMNAIGYKKETIETILNLLNTIPVKTYTEVQVKLQIYEMLLKPDYDFNQKDEK